MMNNKPVLEVSKTQVVGTPTKLSIHWVVLGTFRRFIFNAFFVSQHSGLVVPNIFSAARFFLLCLLP